MDKLRMTSRDVVSDNIEQIGRLFPNCLTERTNEHGESVKAIDFEKLRAELTNDILPEVIERYEFTWPDKRAASRLANMQTDKTLRPDVNESLNFWETENLYIEGDNLDVMKVMRETYLNKIKVIYIDPPYNTGEDFVYRDNFSITTSELGEKSVWKDDSGNRLIGRDERNRQTNGRFHTDWLNMIYPRLKVARNLLTEDGVMFISIDEHEMKNLHKVCDEIFGENNIECLIWNKVAEGSSGTLKACTTTRRVHEYILCCFKDITKVTFTKIKEPLKGRENEFQTANLAVNANKENPLHPNYFTITNPSGDKFTHQWKWDKAEIERLIAEDLLFWGRDGHRKPRLIIPTDDRRTTYLQSILNYGGTTVGRKDFEALMGHEIEFSYPKPVSLLTKILETSTRKDSIVLDFFSGSATTAQAVMQLNAADNGNRKFILIQLPEETDENSFSRRDGYKTICQIAEERIRRSGMQTGMIGKDVDTGFRVLKLDSSNMENVYYAPKDFDPEVIDGIVDNIKPDRTPLDLLFQVMLDLGVKLSVEIKNERIGNSDVFVVDNGYLTATFDTDIDEMTVTEIAKMKPKYFVMRDASAKSDKVLDNFEQIFNLYSPESSLKIL